MSQIIWTNDAKSTLAGAIGPADVTINLSSGTGALFPQPSAGQYFTLTLQDAATGLKKEITHCTAMTGDVATVTRGQEGTSPQSFNAGDLAFNLITAASLAAMEQTATTHGLLLSETLYTGNVTLSLGGNVPAGTNTVEVELQGGGGSGAGVAITDGSHAQVGGSGGAGTWGRFTMAVAVADGQSIVIGAAGAAPAAGANPGNVGSSTTLGGTLAVCPGGTAGPTAAASTGPAIIGSNGHSAAATAGAGVTLLENAVGQTGFPGWVLSATVLESGFGGSSFYGPGGEGAANGAGGAGLAPGAGGSGAGVPASSSAAAGGAGKAGIAIVRCYS